MGKSIWWDDSVISRETSAGSLQGSTSIFRPIVSLRNFFGRETSHSAVKPLRTEDPSLHVHSCGMWGCTISQKVLALARAQRNTRRATDFIMVATPMYSALI